MTKCRTRTIKTSSRIWAKSLRAHSEQTMPGNIMEKHLVPAVLAAQPVALNKNWHAGHLLNQYHPPVSKPPYPLSFLNMPLAVANAAGQHHGHDVVQHWPSAARILCQELVPGQRVPVLAPPGGSAVCNKAVTRTRKDFLQLQTNSSQACLPAEIKQRMSLAVRNCLCVMCAHVLRNIHTGNTG